MVAALSCELLARIRSSHFTDSSDLCISLVVSLECGLLLQSGRFFILRIRKDYSLTQRKTAIDLHRSGASKPNAIVEDATLEPVEVVMMFAVHTSLKSLFDKKHVRVAGRRGSQRFCVRDHPLVLS